jgi:LysM repeat protein
MTTLLRVALLSLTAIACLLAAPDVDAARADAAQVTVVSPGGAQQTLALDALAGQEDVVGGTYALRGPEGESSLTVTGFSLAAVLEAAGADPFGFSYLEVQRPAGGAVLLSRHQALDPGAFAEGPPVVYATGAGTGFLRPSAGPEDLNAVDSFEAPQGVTLVLRKGSPLKVRAKASTVRTRPGQEVSFSAIVEQAGAGEELTYSWYFDDGRSASGAEVRHSFAERGSYDVVVGVTTPGDSAGASAVVTVQVGAPLAGPDRKGGGTSKDAKAPDHGTATGEERAPPSGTAPATPAPSASSHLCPHSETKCELTPDGRHRKPDSQASESPQGEQVTGLLLTSANTSPPEPPADTAAARTGKLSDGGGGGGLSDTALGALAALGLLGLGALGEVRGLGSLLPRRL